MLVGAKIPNDNFSGADQIAGIRDHGVSVDGVGRLVPF